MSIAKQKTPNKKVLFGGLGAGTLVVALAILWGQNIFGQVQHWGARDQETTIPVEDVLDTIAQGEKLTLHGDFSNVNLDGYIEVDGAYMGRLNEDGFFDTSFTFTANDTALMRIDVGGETVHPDATAISYIAYDADGNVLGYCEEFLGDTHSGEQEYVYYFFDGEKVQRPFFQWTEQNITQDEYYVLNHEGETVVGIGYEVNLGNNVFTIDFHPRMAGELTASQWLMLMATVEQQLSNELSTFTNGH